MKKQIGILIFALAIAIGLSGAVEAQNHAPHATPSVTCPSGEEGPSHVGPSAIKIPRGVHIGPREWKIPSHWGPKLPKQIPGMIAHRHGLLIHDGILRIPTKHGPKVVRIKNGKVIHVK